MSKDDVTTKPAATPARGTTGAAPATDDRDARARGRDAPSRRRDALAVRPAAGRRTSYAQLGRDVRAIAKGLMALGIQAGDRVAILSNTRAEWTLADFGAICAGATVVPVYQTNSPEECEYVLDHSGAMALFCEDDDQLAKLAEIRDALPKLEHVFRFEARRRRRDDARRAARGGRRRLRRRARRARRGDRLRRRRDDRLHVRHDRAAEGLHAHARQPARRHRRRPPSRRSSRAGDDVVYVFLPLAHVLTRIVQLVAIDAGAEMAYWRRDPKKIVEDVQLIKPTHLPSVPRIFEKIHTAATAKADAAGGAKAKIFHWAVGVGREVRRREDRGGHPGLVLKAQYALADKLVLHKIRDLFGGRVKLALTGAAPIDTEILEFFHAAGIWVLEGYGMTETCAVETLNTIEDHRFGTVGRPLPGVCEVKIADDGEVLMRGPNIFKGYLRQPGGDGARR